MDISSGYAEMGPGSIFNRVRLDWNRACRFAEVNPQSSLTLLSVAAGTRTTGKHITCSAVGTHGLALVGDVEKDARMRRPKRHRGIGTERRQVGRLDDNRRHRIGFAHRHTFVS